MLLEVPAPPVRATEVSVRDATDGDAAAWRDYVNAHPAATVFHRWEWRTILERTFRHEPHYLVATRSGRIAGVLPLMQVRTWLFGHALVSLPFCSWAGPLADDDAALEALDDAAAALADRLGVDHLEYRHLGEPRHGRPLQDLYVCFSGPISGDHEANLKAIPRKQRAMVRKGIANQLVSGIESVDEFFPLYADNVHRHGTPPVPPRFFRAMAEAFGDDCEILVVRDRQGAALSGVLTLYHRDEVFPFYAGDVVAARELAANDFKYWEVMRRGADRGARVFNYGRSKRGTGSFSFQKNWGFQPTPLSYEFRLGAGKEVPQNNPNNPRYRLLISTWRRMPRWAVNAAGPLLVRGLG